MSDLSVKTNVAKQDARVEPVETGGVIASADTNTPSPLFNAVPSAETGGSIASSSSGGSSSAGGSTSFVC